LSQDATAIVSHLAHLPTEGHHFVFGDQSRMQLTQAAINKLSQSQQSWQVSGLAQRCYFTMQSGKASDTGSQVLQLGSAWIDQRHGGFP